MRTTTTVVVPHAVTSAGVVRRRLRAELHERGIAPPVAEDLTLLASELVGNAVRHAQALPGGVLEVVWQLDDRRATLTVTDGGGRSWPRLRADLDEEALGGRGLAIVDKLAEEWGVRSSPQGTSVWVVVDEGLAAAAAGG